MRCEYCGNILDSESGKCKYCGAPCCSAPKTQSTQQERSDADTDKQKIKKYSDELCPMSSPDISFLKENQDMEESTSSGCIIVTTIMIIIAIIIIICVLL